MLDNQIYSFPTIDYKQYATGSTRPGRARRSPACRAKEAQNLALVLQTGALPVQFVTVERSDVSATLGKDSLHQAQTAAIVGLIAVASSCSCSTASSASSP